MKLLDLFCGAGGAAEGYRRAGFDEIVGVDIKPQPRYPFEFIQGDALAVGEGGLSGTDYFDAIHASPPCQRYSSMTTCRPGLSDEYPDYIGVLRDRLEASGVPWVIENVPGSPLRSPAVLCGQMFGLRLYRHRLFETSFTMPKVMCPGHPIPASKAGHWKPGTIISVAGHVAPIKEAREAMGIDWMNRAELGEAVPPAYTEFVGRQMIAAIRAEAVA